MFRFGVWVFECALPLLCGISWRTALEASTQTSPTFLLHVPFFASPWLCLPSTFPAGISYLFTYLLVLLALELLERAAVPVCPTSCTVSGTRSALSKYLQKKERFQEGCRTIFSVESPHSEVGSGAECCKWLHLKHCTFTSWAHVDGLPFLCL